MCTYTRERIPLSPVYCFVLFCTDTCEVGETCLAPPSNAVAMLEGHYNTTPTTIEVWWPLPPLIECCAETVFSYPLAQYKYGVNPEVNVLHAYP